MTQQQPQQLTLNPLQLLQITSEVLGQLKEWVEKKKGTPDESHPAHDVTAAKSLHHARLLCNMKANELMRELQRKQEEQRREVMGRLPPQSRLNLQAAQVVGQNSAAKSVDDLWREAGLSHYLEVGRP